MIFKAILILEMYKDKNIVLVELDFHNEVVNAIALQLLANDVNLIIACKPFIYNNIPDLQNHPKINWLLQAEKESNFDFLKRILSTNPEDAYLINGFGKIEKSFLQLDIAPNTGYIVHDIHSIYAPYNNLSFHKSFFDGLKDLAKFILFIIKGQRKVNIRFLDKMNKIVLPADTVLQYAENKKLITQKLMRVKFAINQYPYTISNQAHVSIVIPGTIIEKSRDYDSVILALQKIDFFRKKVQLVLLGRVVDKYGKRIVKSMLALQNKSLEIKVFDRFIDQKVFDNYMLQADFLILPIQRYMNFQFFRELNSRSCVSGNINDMVRYAKPSLIPDYYKLDHSSMEHMIARYTSHEELVDLIQKWVHTQEYKSLDYTKALSLQDPKRNGAELLKNLLST